MDHKILIEININPTVESIKIYDGDIDSLLEDEIENVLEKLRYTLDGFDIRRSGDYKISEQTKVKIIITNR